MLFLETVLFLAAAVAAGFVIARYVLVQPSAVESDPGGVRWRIEAENAARERDLLRAELEEARREQPVADESEARIAHLKSAVHAAKRRIEELERELESTRGRGRPAPTTRTGTAGVAPAALPAPEGPADDLKRINGIGPGIERSLNQLGIWHYRQLAALTAENIAWLDSQPTLRGRVERQDWVAQARALATPHPVVATPTEAMVAPA